MKPQTKVSIALLVLLAATLVTGMTGGCGEPITESVSYGSPNWMTDGRIVASKTVVREKQRGFIPGYMTYERIFEGEYIVTMKDDGTDEKEIYGGGDKYGKIGEIVASPLGNYLGYAGYENEQHGIAIITSDGSKEVKFISSEAVNSFDWSPDETKIAYSGKSSRDLYVVNVSDESKVKIATSAEAVAWRVGEKIAFVTYTGTQSALTVSVMNTDGTNIKYLKTFASDPQILIGANEIIYSGLGNEVRKIKVDGSEDVLLFGNYDRVTLKLSFDNTKIAGGGGVWVVDISGKNLRKLRD